ncbi:hypothetical protein [Streptomyces sp. LN549]|uniref:hypothetical protein n=1 Tax=Streptomyces sp. LN549 TaxID=3112979 RepID=UPI00371F5823
MAAGFPFCPPPPRRGGATGDFSGAGFLVGGTETAAAAEAVAAEADGVAECAGLAECAGEGAVASAGVRAGLALRDGVAAAGVPGGVPSELPDSEQPAAASASPSTTSSADAPRGPRFRIIPAPSKTIMR